MKIYTKNDLDSIVKHLKNNEIFAIKTDTVYGIMAVANKENEEKINIFKKSSLDKKISIIFPDKETLIKYCVNLNEEKKNLIDEKLPGKYTFIVKLSNFSNFNRNDFGVRVTSYDFLQNIIKETGPLLASSCNITGEEICTKASEIEDKFRDTELNLVEDIDATNEASTIISLIDEIKIIRK